METILSIKVVLAAIGAAIVGWYLIQHAHRGSERNIRGWLKRRDSGDRVARGEPERDPGDRDLP